MPRTILKPPRLRKGDTIGLISPASPPSSSEKIEKSVQYFERLGYRVKVGAHVSDETGYLAGSDKHRAEDFNAMIRDKLVKAIIAVRGGYGTPRILSLIDYASVKRNPKIIVGYSDLTALHLALFQKIGLVTFSGPMAGVELWKNPDPFTEEHFWRCVTSPRAIGVLRNPSESPTIGYNKGRAQGRMLGGNLSLMISSFSTPYVPSFRKSLLVLEEIDEAPHRVDRMVTQLANARILRNISGLILGHFTDCVPYDPSKPTLTVDQVLGDMIGSLTIPVLTNLQYGHTPKKLTIPIGVRASIDSSSRSLEVLEAAVK